MAWLPAENWVLMRLAQKIITEEDRAVADAWRSATANMSLATLTEYLNRNHVIVPSAKSIDELPAVVDTLLDHSSLQDVWFGWVVGTIRNPRLVAEVRARWQREGSFLKIFAPYAHFCLRALLMLFIANHERHSRANSRHGPKADVVEENSGRERIRTTRRKATSDLNLDSLGSVCQQWSRCRLRSFPVSSSCRRLVVAEARTSQRRRVRARPKRLDLGSADRARACRYQSRKQHRVSRCGASCQRTWQRHAQDSPSRSTTPVDSTSPMVSACAG